MDRRLSKTFCHRALSAVALAAVIAASGSAHGAGAPVEGVPTQGTPAPFIDRPAAQPKGAEQSEVERFCSNIADAARDRRYALQAEELKKLQAEVDQRIALLEERKSEYETWLKRREVFLARAEEGVVQIYSRMKPDAAAERLAMMNVELAAAILMKLDARKSSVILNEMESKSAADLTRIMASASRRQDPS